MLEKRNIHVAARFAHVLGLVLVCLPLLNTKGIAAQGCVFHSKDGRPYKVHFPLIQPKNPVPGTRHLKVVVFGDSAAWGNGDKPEHRLANIVSQNLADDTGQPVDLDSYAHSGALMISAPSDNPGYPVRHGRPVSDVGNSRPATEEQAVCATVEDSDADLVILDGCINDVGAFNIAIPPFLFNKTTPDEIRNGGSGKTGVIAACAAPMRDTLLKIKGWFPNAKIVLMNYWLVVSNDSKPTPETVRWTDDQKAARTVKVQKVIKKYSNGDSRTVETQTQAWEDNAAEFLRDTTACFTWAVASANANSILPPITHSDTTQPAPACDPYQPAADQPVAPTRIFLARVSENPNYSYGAPDTHLWALPIPLIFGFAIGPDEMFRKRNCECDRTSYLFRNDVDCKVNPTAHPNLAGAQCYSKAILETIGQKWIPPSVSVNCD